MSSTKQHNDKAVTKPEMYRDAIVRHFGFFKESNSLAEIHVKAIEIQPNLGSLIPLSKLHLEDTELLIALTEWRNENKEIYPSQIEATLETTRSWLLEKVLNIQDRVLFLVTDKFGKVVGHIGLAQGFKDLERGICSLQLDNMIRAIPAASPGLMTKAMNALIDWMNEKLMPDQIYLRILSDNTKGIEYYKQRAFVQATATPLFKQMADNGVLYREAGSSESNTSLQLLKFDYKPAPMKAGDELILTAGPSISALETYYAYDAAKTGWNNKWSFYIKKFEKEFAEYVGVEHALSTSSCTGALHLGLLALGIGPGDEVIVPDITWVATANAVAYTGATPIFADVLRDSWCIDPESIKKKLTEKTKAIIPVHLYGHSADMEAVMKIAKENKLFVVEDAAPAVGTIFKNQKVGTFGDFAAFSFQGAKLTVSGEGGMLVTDNKALYEKAYSLWDQGRDLTKTFWINDTGWKYKMSNVQAAVGLGQLQRVEELIYAKRRIFGWYDERLKDLPGLQMCYESKDTRSIYWMSSIQVLPNARVTRDQLREELRKRNVDTRPAFPAISQYPMWTKRQDTQPVAKEIGLTALNLPSGHCLKEEQIDYVCRQIRELI